jgi:hypothetical protein
MYQTLESHWRFDSGERWRTDTVSTVRELTNYKGVLMLTEAPKMHPVNGIVGKHIVLWKISNRHGVRNAFLQKETPKLRPEG